MFYVNALSPTATTAELEVRGLEVTGPVRDRRLRLAHALKADPTWTPPLPEPAG